MHKLLVPVDGSDNAMRALEYTIRLAKAHGPIELVILYAHEPPIVYGELAIYLHQPGPDRRHSIVSCAETLGCDGIVMGTRGMGAIGNLVAGSVATKVIHLTKLPVTLVK